eukprot:5048130-Pyramimonas_sp.AAC.1
MRKYFAPTQRPTVIRLSVLPLRESRRDPHLIFHFLCIHYAGWKHQTGGHIGRTTERRAFVRVTLPRAGDLKAENVMVESATNDLKVFPLLVWTTCVDLTHLTVRSWRLHTT